MWTDIVHSELRKCTDCGLCLSSCPTFMVSRAEGDSPRGRVHLLDLALTGAAPEPVSAGHLSGCIECGACHVPCPTGVRVAVARQAHRLASEVLDWAGFEVRAAQLAELINTDAGARLTIDAVWDLRTAVTGGAAQGSVVHGGVLPLFGPLLRRGTPRMVSALEGRLSGAPGIIEDPALTGALERASGLLGDAGLSAEHARAVGAAADLATARGYCQLTVAVLDWLLLRLRDAGLPKALRVVPAHQVFGLAIPQADAVVWDHPGEVPGAMLHCDVLPTGHSPASAPALLSGPALRVLSDLIKAKRRWLAGRTLLTMDARSLARFPEARHIAEFIVPSAAPMGGK